MTKLHYTCSLLLNTFRVYCKLDNFKNNQIYINTLINITLIRALLEMFYIMVANKNSAHFNHTHLCLTLSLSLSFSLR